MPIGIRPNLASIGYEDSPIQIGLRAIVDEEMGESFTFGRLEGQGRVKLEYHRGSPSAGIIVLHVAHDPELHIVQDAYTLSII